MGRLADMRRIFSLNAVGEHVWKRLDGLKKTAANPAHYKSGQGLIPSVTLLGDPALRLR